MGRFFLGFAIGAALGVAAVFLSARGEDTGESLAVRADAGGGVKSLLSGAVEAGRTAAGSREQELRAEFRARLAKAQAARGHSDSLAL